MEKAEEKKAQKEEEQESAPINLSGNFKLEFKSNDNTQKRMNIFAAKALQNFQSGIIGPSSTISIGINSKRKGVTLTFLF